MKAKEVEIADGGDYDLGNVETGTTQEMVFTIVNQGESDLEITGAALTGDNAFEITQLPASPLLPNGQTGVAVQFSATETGTKTAVLTISSDDEDESEYVIHLTATG